MKQALFARMPKANPGGHHDWISRDYATLDCRAVGCLFNIQAQCAVPSACKIGEDGHCLAFQAKPAPRGLGL